MRITLTDSPRNIAYIPTFRHIVARVISGDCIIGRDRQNLSDGGGLPVSASDGILNLAWDVGPLWMAGSPTCEIEVLIP